jgi:hypothetical protein
MRTIQTYILRLLVDSDEPHTVRGAIRAVADGEEQAFADGQALLALLCRLYGQASSREDGHRSAAEGRKHHEDK